MLSPLLTNLLILQERDTRRLAQEAQLKAVPREVAAVEARIASEKGAIDAARGEMRELEAKKKVIETEIGSAEVKLTKYRNQQLQVKKNDEFQALGHEIGTVQGQIGELEGNELEIMYSIDEAKKRFVAAEAALKQNIAGHESRLRALAERETNLKASLEAVRAEVAAARAPIDEPALKTYDRIAVQKQPVCVPVKEGKCGGCHLKVSSEVESASRGRNPDVRLPICDQCGRIVYWEAA